MAGPVDAVNGRFTEYWILLIKRKDGSSWGIKPTYSVPDKWAAQLCGEDFWPVLEELLHKPENKAFLQAHEFNVVDKEP